MPNYAAIPDFGQLVEYVTQGPLVDGVYGVVINTVPLVTYDLAGTDGSDVGLKLNSVLDDFVHVLAKRNMNLSGIDFSVTIPTAILTKINAFLTARSWPTVPAGYTYRQLLTAVKAML